MATPARRCLICGKSLVGRGPRAQTCGEAHKKALQRRNARRIDTEREAAGRGADTMDEITSLVNFKTQDAIRAAFVEEVRPIIREAIDNDAIRAIQGMVGLAPAAIMVLAQDLKSDDPVLRSKAATLVVKYTMGNQLVTPPRVDQSAGLVIVNQLPRPAVTAVDGTPPPELPPAVDTDEVRRCDTCALDKPLVEFPGDGPRCEQCLAEAKARVIDQFLKPDERTALTSANALRQSTTAEDVQRQSISGRSQVHQAGAGLQPGDLRPQWMVPERHANPAGHEGGSPPQGPVRDAAGTFSGPPDPHRWSTGR